MTLQTGALAELASKDLIATYYRWWNVSGWWGPTERGVKLGPVTVWVSHPYRRWRLTVAILCRFTLYDGVMRELRRREYT